MEKARPMREQMDGKVVYFPPESALLPLMLYLSNRRFQKAHKRFESGATDVSELVFDFPYGAHSNSYDLSLQSP